MFGALYAFDASLLLWVCQCGSPRASREGPSLLIAAGVPLWCSEGRERAVASDAAPRRGEARAPEDAAAHLRRRREKTTTTGASLLVAEAPAFDK